MNKTKTGLLLIMIGMAISIIATATMFLTPDDLSGIFALVGIAIIAGVGGLIALIGGLLILIGGKEFGEKHRKFTIYALIMWLLSLIIPFVISMLSTIMAIGSYDPTSPSYYQSTTMNITAIQTPITAALYGLVYIFLLYQLENKTGRIVLFAAYIVSIIFSIFTGLAYLAFFGDFLGAGTVGSTDPTEIFSSISAIGKIAVLSIPGSLLYLIAVYIPYKRITSGELAPVVTTPTPGAPSTPHGVQQDRKCPECGRMIPFDAQTCPYCGREFNSFI